MQRSVLAQYRLEFAAPRYEEVVVMNPDAYDWIPEGAEGVDIKWIGAFTERDAKIGFIRLDKGATYQAGLLPAITILFQTKGEIIAHNTQYPKGSAFEFLPEEGPVAFTAVEPAEFLCMTLHRF